MSDPKFAPADKHRIMEELDWHVGDVKLAYELLTHAEGKEILKRGFVPRELSIDLNARVDRHHAELRS